MNFIQNCSADHRQDGGGIFGPEKDRIELTPDINKYITGAILITTALIFKRVRRIPRLY